MAMSLRKLADAGIISRGNLNRIAHSSILIKDGLNLRDVDADFLKSCEELAAMILDGMDIPPLKLATDDEGMTWYIVDGERRYRALGIAIENAAARGDTKTVERLSTVDFKVSSGDPLEQLDEVNNSNDNRPLTDLERAKGYARYSATGLSSQNIADRVHRSRAHVEQLLILASADDRVKDLVRRGLVKTTLAISTVRKHGDGAFAVLVGAGNGGKTTQGAVEGRPLPKEVAAGLESGVAGFVRGMDPETILRVEQFCDAGRHADLDGSVSVPLSLLAGLFDANHAADTARQTIKERAQRKAVKAAQTDIEGE